LVDVNRGAMEQLARLRGQLPGSAEQVAAYFFSQDFLAGHPETLELFRGSRRTADQAARRALMVQAAPPAMAFADITAPALLLAGGGDRLVPPAETFRLARLIANTRQQELSALPHVASIEDPERVAHAIMDFLLPQRSQA
jgi:3-oxoadipate enol-lactonase